MKPKRPHKLSDGGIIGVTAPASPVDEEKLNRGINYLNDLGYRVEVGESCYKKTHYLAGSDRDRADEFMQFVRNPRIDAIFCARGGYGSMRILPMLDFKEIRKKAKLLVGFSDITALQWAIWNKSRLITVSGGMVATDMARRPVNQTFENQFWNLLQSGELKYPLSHQQMENQTIEGRLLPGTLSVAVRLAGTSYFPRPDGLIPLLEDVNEPTHKIEGSLMHMKLLDFLDRIQALLVGQISPSEHEEYEDLPTYKQMIQDVCRDQELSILTGLPYGHIDHKISLPVGASISLYLGSESELTMQQNLYQP